MSRRVAAQAESATGAATPLGPEQLRTSIKGNGQLLRATRHGAVVSKPNSTDPLLKGAAFAPKEEMEFSVINDQCLGTSARNDVKFLSSGWCAREAHNNSIQ